MWWVEQVIEEGEATGRCLCEHRQGTDAGKMSSGRLVSVCWALSMLGGKTLSPPGIKYWTM